MKHQKRKQINKLEGTIFISSKGVGYVKVLGQEEDVEINFKHLNTALHGDTVQISLNAKKNRRITGEVISIISRAKLGFSGVLEEENHLEALPLSKGKTSIFFLKPDDTKMYTDILIPEKSLNGAKVGEKVYAKIVFWKDASKAPEGKIEKVLGKPGSNDTEMRAIAIEKGFDSDLPSKVEEEARKIKNRGIKKEDLVGRKDFRKTLTFTIDPEDAKDFDDAISFKELNKDPLTPQKTKRYEIGVHIADVTFYVKIGSELDKEARERGTSVYLVDRTIPMLPEALSNDLCSLVPNKDRLAMSAVFIIDENANVLEEWYGRTVIHSKQRFTYQEAEESIHKNGVSLHKELSTLNNLAKKLTKERFLNGAISLDQEEVKFILDKNGKPLKVIKKERGDSNKLIEEFMLLANKKVAETISRGVKKSIQPNEAGRQPDKVILADSGGENGIFVYRIHESPNKEKMADLAFFLRSLGHKVSLVDGVIPTKEINDLLKKLEGKNEAGTVHRAVIRSMAKAIYSTKNIGHYGLAFKYYAHFTSPIRRYPDMVVHRILDDYVKGIKVGKEKLDIYEKISRKASEREKNASDAERASIKYKQVEYMSSRINKVFKGIISGITEWGIYVEEMETKCEGLVKIRDMGDDFYIFNEKKLELLGEKKKKRYRLGDIVKIKVKNTDLEKKIIDYVLV